MKTITKLSFLCLILSFTFRFIQDPAYAKPDISGIPLGFNPAHITVNPVADIAVVSNEKDETVSIVDLESGTVIDTIPVGKFPDGTAVDHELNIALVANRHDHTVSIIDLDTRKVVLTIPVGEQPERIAVNQNTHIGLVTNRKGDTISVIDLNKTGIAAVSAVKTIPVGHEPIDVAIDPGLNIAVVVNQKDWNVSIMDLNDYHIRGTIKVGKKPGAIDINPETHLAVVANEKDNSVTVIDLSTLKTYAIPVGKHPIDVAINRLDNRALVICDEDREQYYIDLETGEIITIYSLNKLPKAAAINNLTNIAGVVDQKTDSLTLIQLPNPVPELSSITPDEIVRGDEPVTIILKGSGFIKTSRASLPASVITTLVDNHTLEIEIPAEIYLNEGIYGIIVKNPEPGGGVSNPVEVTITKVPGDTEPEAGYVPGHLIIKLKDEPAGSLTPRFSGCPSLDTLMELFNVQEVRLLDPFPDKGDLELKKELGISRTYLLIMPPSTDMEEALSAFSVDPCIENAEPDHISSLAAINVPPNDPEYWTQWNLWAWSGIDAPEAWFYGSIGNPSVVLAILDTGADFDHPDLAGKFVYGYDYLNWDDDPQDDHGHGTHVAGIAAAWTDNEEFIAGVCPECSIMPIKVCDGFNDCPDSPIANGIYFALDNGYSRADVINMSIGGSSPASFVHDAIKYAYARNVPVVAAAGQIPGVAGTETTYYPAGYAETIAVGASDASDHRWLQSFYGNHIDLVAPGESICSTLWDDTYACWPGTSMATPHVTGVIGLMIARSGPLSVEEIRRRLRDSADDIYPPFRDKYTGNGRLNAYRSVLNITARPDISVEPSSGNFGNVHVGGSSTETFTIRNAGNATLLTGTITITGDSSSFTIASDGCNKKNIRNGSCTVKVAFSPASAGTKGAYLTIPSNDADTPTTYIPLNGSGYVTLKVQKDGTGAGTVTSSPPGINCGPDCSENYSSVTTVTLTAAPVNSCSVFAGWSGGGCSGTGACTVTMKSSDITVTATFNVKPPTADFSASPVTGKIPLPVYFTDLSACATEWTWDFGDGSTRTKTGGLLETYPLWHNYQETGVYTVSLTVKNVSGSAVKTMTDLITAQPCSNIPDRRMRIAGAVPQYFSTVQDAYNAAADGDTIQALAVDFSGNLNAGRNISVTMEGGYDCDYTTNPVETSLNGEVNVNDGTLTIGNFDLGPPIGYFTGAPVAGKVPLAVFFTEYSPKDSFGWSWDFGDGSTDTEKDPVHTYKREGVYTVSHTVYYPGGSDTERRTDYINVSPCPNIPNRQVRIAGAMPQYFSTIQDAYNAAADGDTIQSLALDFKENLDISRDITAALAGGYDCDYTANLVDTTLVGELTVNAGTLDIGDFILETDTDFSASPLNGYAPLAVNFTNRSSSSATSPSWDFGDGGVGDVRDPYHVYKNPGAYTVSLTMLYKDGPGTRVRTDYITTQACPNLPVRITGAVPVYYATIQEAYDAAVDGDIIQSLAVDLAGGLDANRAIAVTFDGGYDCLYTMKIWATTIEGAVSINDGEVTIGDFTVGK